MLRPQCIEGERFEYWSGIDSSQHSDAARRLLGSFAVNHVFLAAVMQQSVSGYPSYNPE